MFHFLGCQEDLSNTSRNKMVLVANQNLSHILYFVGPVSNGSRDMAMGSWFMEGSWPLAVSQLDSDTDGILP